MQPSKDEANVANLRSPSLSDSSSGVVVAWLPKFGGRKKMSWIKVDTRTIDKPEVRKMARLLAISRQAVLGHCICFWSWCDEHQKNGVTIMNDVAEIDDIVDLNGFGQAMLEIGWLSVVDGTVRIPNFDRHLGKAAKIRAREGARKAAERAAIARRSTKS